MSVMIAENSASAIWQRTIESKRSRLAPAAARALLRLRFSQADLERADPRRNVLARRAGGVSSSSMVRTNSQKPATPEDRMVSALQQPGNLFVRFAISASLEVPKRASCSAVHDLRLVLSTGMPSLILRGAVARGARLMSARPLGILDGYPRITALVRPSCACETSSMRPYEELVTFIASLSPREVVDFKPSEAARQRVWDLLERQKAAPLPADEKSELDHYLEIEHLMRLAKARARQLLAHGP